MTNQIVGYIRVSSERQNTARQLADIKLDKEFIDKISGGTTSRAGLIECMSYVREGDTLVVDSIDRLARNLRDLQGIIKSLVDKGVAVRFVKEGLTFTGKEDAMANLLLQVMGSFAEFENTMIKARQRDGIDAAKKAGKVCGRAPVITPKLIEEAKVMIEDGTSIRKTAMTLKVSRMTIYKILGKYASKPEWSFDSVVSDK